MKSAAPHSPAGKYGKNLAWTIEYDPGALKDLKKLDRAVQREILDYLDTRVATAVHPSAFGKPSRASKFGLWRNRVRDYHIICEVEEKRLVLAVGHRSTVYGE